PTPTPGPNYPTVDPSVFAGIAKNPIATVTGEELQSAIEGGQVVIRLPVPPEPVPTPTPTPTPTPKPTPTPTPAASPAPSPSPGTEEAAGPTTTMHVYAVRTTAQAGEQSAYSSLAYIVLQPTPAAPSDLAVEARARGINLSWKSTADTVIGFA